MIENEKDLGSRISNTLSGRNIKPFNANEEFEKIYDKAAAASSGKTR